MATPLKSLKLTSQILSPRLSSPRIISPIQFKNNTILSPNLNLVKSNTLNVNNNQFIINSPNKKHLSKHGILHDNLFEIIGKGTFGTVIKGILDDVQVAVKVVKISKSKKIKEYNSLDLSHPNIIKTLDIIVNNSSNYGVILMDYYPNSQSLQNIICEKISKTTAKNFAEDICNGLLFCHKNNILHLDIKPKNIIICDGICKICDFGNSTKISEAKEYSEYRGTVAYSAPELLKGETPTVKCDVYSVGILLWQLDTHRIPYENINNEVVIYKVVKFNLRPQFSTKIINYQFKDICVKCWNSNEKKRPHIQEILDLLGK